MKKGNGIKWVIILFIALSIMIFLADKLFPGNNINLTVVFIANVLLFLLSLLSHLMHAKAAKNPNPNVLVRSVMAGTGLKLFVLAASTIIYLILSKSNPNIPAIVSGMVLYIFYTVLDVKDAMNLNTKK